MDGNFQTVLIQDHRAYLREAAGRLRSISSRIGANVNPYWIREQLDALATCMEEDSREPTPIQERS